MDRCQPGFVGRPLQRSVVVGPADPAHDPVDDVDAPTGRDLPDRQGRPVPVVDTTEVTDRQVPTRRADRPRADLTPMDVGMAQQSVPPDLLRGEPVCLGNAVDALQPGQCRTQRRQIPLRVEGAPVRRPQRQRTHPARRRDPESRSSWPASVGGGADSRCFLATDPEPNAITAQGRSRGVHCRAVAFGQPAHSRGEPGEN